MLRARSGILVAFSIVSTCAATLQLQAQTLSDVLRQNYVTADAGLGDRSERQITSYAARNADELFAIAYYWAPAPARAGDPPGGTPLADTLYVSLFNKSQGSWTHAAYSRTALKDRSHNIGSALRISFTRDHIFIDTHVNPSAGTVLVLSRSLQLITALNGWTELLLPGGALVYQKSMVHFAPTHPAELRIFDPASMRDTSLYPTLPYDAVRLQYTERVREIYSRLGDDWFRLNNHHMMAELFESRIGTPVADSSGTRIAFIAMFGEGGGTRAATPLVEVLVVCDDVLRRSACSETELSATRLAHPDWSDERILAEALARRL